VSAVRLRLVQAGDSARLLAWRNSPQVSAFMYGDHLISQVEHDRWFAAIASREDRRYWIIEDDGEPVGLANLARIDRAQRRCEWAYYLGEPSTRGKGLGAAVELIVIRYVFETLGLNKLWCEVLADNVAVIRLHERFGFVREALLRDHVAKGGVFRDVVGLGLLRRDWEAGRPAVEQKLRAAGLFPESLPAAP